MYIIMKIFFLDNSCPEPHFQVQPTTSPAPRKLKKCGPNGPRHSQQATMGPEAAASCTLWPMYRRSQAPCSRAGAEARADGRG
jgi:hypothetical protein